MKPTDTDRRRWRELYDAGATIEAISLEEGVHHSTVRRGILEAGGETRPPGGGKRGVTIAKQADGIRGAAEPLTALPAGRDRGRRRKARRRP